MKRHILVEEFLLRDLDHPVTELAVMDGLEFQDDPEAPVVLSRKTERLLWEDVHIPRTHRAPEMDLRLAWRKNDDHTIGMLVRLIADLADQVAWLKNELRAEWSGAKANPSPDKHSTPCDRRT